MTEENSAVIDRPTKMSREDASRFVVLHWGPDWPVSKLEEITGWSDPSIAKFRKEYLESPDAEVLDFSEYAPASYIMEEYRYSRTAFRSVVQRARGELAKEGKTLRTTTGRHPHFFTPVKYYNLEDLESYPKFKERRHYYRVTEGMSEYFFHECPANLEWQEYMVYMVLAIWFLKNPYGPAPSYRSIGKALGVSFSSVGSRIRGLIKKGFIDRQIVHVGGKGKKISYRFVIVSSNLENRFRRINPSLLGKFSKKG